eukprot:scaffold8353_cov138-Cylindrotheca_fusiformis.AAC.7
MVAMDIPNSLPSVGFRTRDGMKGSDRTSKEYGVKAFVSGMMTPFSNCWQASVETCAPTVCATSTYPYFDKPPTVVSLARPGHQENTASPAREIPQYSHPTDNREPHSNDVLCGRGGSSNRHLGNTHFRELVAANKKTYVALTKKQKMLVAKKIVVLVTQTQPPGRFLARDSQTGTWYDIGLPRSLEKTSQALRERNSNDIPDVSPSGATAHTALSRKAVFDDTSLMNAKCIGAPPVLVPPHLIEFYYPRKDQEVATSSWLMPEAQMPSICPSSPCEGYHVGQLRLGFKNPKKSNYFPPHYCQPESAAHDFRDCCDIHAYFPSSESYHSKSRQTRFQPLMRYQPYPPPTCPQCPIRYRYTQSPRVDAGSPNQPIPPKTLRACERQSGPPYLLSKQCQRSSASHSMYPAPNYVEVGRRSDCSPERQQECKRQRNEIGRPSRFSQALLSTAVKDSLYLEARAADFRQSEIKSPSGLLQGRSHRSTFAGEMTDAQTASHEKLSGLAALCTAAFLKLENSAP